MSAVKAGDSGRVHKSVQFVEVEIGAADNPKVVKGPQFRPNPQRGGPNDPTE